MIALIPARAGSTRIPGKNTKLLAGHPLIAYTIAAARQSGVFAHIVVCSDDRAVLALARDLAVATYHREPVPDDQPDIAWVRPMMVSGKDESFAILRPTSPFRTAATIRRAYDQFRRSEVHSIRAVQPVKEHPGKMWSWYGPGYPMLPLMDKEWPITAPGFAPLRRDETPWHSRPTQSLPKVYIQNSSLEMAWTYVIQAFGTISGTKIAPFFTEGHEGCSIDYPDDWDAAEALAAAHPEALPRVDVAALSAPAPAQ